MVAVARVVARAVARVVVAVARAVATAVARAVWWRRLLLWTVVAGSAVAVV